MAIIDTFDYKTEAIINPAQLAPPIDGFPKIAISSFNSHCITMLQDNYEPMQIEETGGGESGSSQPIYQVNYENKEIAVYRSLVGGPISTIQLEKMISKGCEKFVFWGSCGVLDKEIAAKSLIVPIAAYRDEGTSYHYMPPSEYIEVTTAAKLAEILTELKMPHVCGKTWTTDAPFRETRGNMEKRKKDGCFVVEMECASLMAVAQFRGVEVYQFLYAADSLDGVEWDARTLGSLPQDSREKFLRIALEIAIRV